MIQRTLQEHYASEPFVRIRDQNPTTRDVCHTNFCDVSVRESGDYVILLSAIDNLVKGASGAAVQNFNLMYKFPETTAL
jgi:N-acetyl-gamma-glutamyl-phosphate reductase